MKSNQSNQKIFIVHNNTHIPKNANGFFDTVVIDYKKEEKRMWLSLF